jgi:prephenate dehydrogenase
MPKWNTVAIVGVGLIGGSIGLALRRRDLAHEIVGIGRTASTLAVARKRGLVTRTTTDLAAGVRDAELIVVCTPVDCVADHVLASAAACPDDALITDAASTKVDIVGRVTQGMQTRGSGSRDPGDGPTFIGGHPLAGSHRQGPREATAELFEKRTVILTPSRKTPVGALERLTRFWKSLGATVHQMTPQRHDRVLATTSHLPHVVASALSAATKKPELAFAAGGWSDSTRIAAGDPDLWTQILRSNAANVLDSLAHFEQQIAAFRAALESDDPRPLKQFLAKAKQTRDALGS